MSVASRNAFALLGDEDGAPAAVSPAVKKEIAAAAPKRTVVGLNTNRNGARGASEAKGNARAAGGAGEGDQEAPQRDSRSSRGAARGGRGEGRGGRGGRGAGGRGGRGRQFDRHSATGKEDSHKKVEQGWGGDDAKRELDAEDGAKADAAAEEDTTGEAGDKKEAPKANGAPPVEKELAPVEEEKDNTKTLDEYLAEQAAKRAQIGALKEARPAETDAKALGTKMEKQSDEDYFKAQKERSNRQRERKEKQILEIEQSFNAPPAASRGAGRGGRGSGRGRGGERGRGFGGERGAGRGRGGRGRGGSAGANINLSDSAAFPTLG